MKKIDLFSLLILLVGIGCQERVSTKIEVKNSIGNNISDQIVTIKISELSNVDVNNLSALDGENEIPSQLVDVNADGKMDNIAFLVNLNANQTKSISLIKAINE